MAFNFKKRKVVSPKFLLTLEIELNDSTLTAQEAADNVSRQINMYNAKEFSALIVFLIRETNSSTWELRKLEINDAPQ